jgi:hypothetical protein
MLTYGAKECLSESCRREIFRLLVTGQDLDMSVPESRRMVMDLHQVTERLVIEIEMEGIRRCWLPLNS